MIAHCREALALADRLGDAVAPARRRALEERLGMAYFYVSEFAAAAEAFDRAAERADEPAVRTVALSGAWLGHFWAHAYDAAAGVNDRLRDLAHRHGLVRADAVALANEGFTRGVCDGDTAAEDQLLGAAVRIAEREGDEATVAMARMYMTQTAEWTGDYRRAITIGEATIAAGRRLRLAHLVVWPCWFVGKAACCVGDYGRAIAQLTEAYEVCDRIGDRAWKTRLLNTLGWCYAEIGSVTRAREFNQRASAAARAIGDPEIVANSELNLALNALALGEPGRAAEHLAPIRAGLEHPGDPWMRWRYSLHVLDVAARLALTERRPEETLALADEQLAGARRHRVPKVEARALALRGEALLALERRDDAEAAFADAVRVADAIEHPRVAWLALAGLAEVARRGGRATDAARHASRRRELVSAAAASLQTPDLRRALEASVAG